MKKDQGLLHVTYNGDVYQVLTQRGNIQEVTVFYDGNLNTFRTLDWERQVPISVRQQVLQQLIYEQTRIFTLATSKDGKVGY